MLYYKEKTIKMPTGDFSVTYIADSEHHNIATLYGKVRKLRSPFDKLHNIIDIVNEEGRLIGMFWECVHEQEAEKDTDKTTPARTI